MYYCKALFDDLDRLAAAKGGEKELIRELAGRCVEIAHSEKMRKIKKRWCDIMAMRKPDRPPVWCHGNASWDEIMPPQELVCRDPLCRELEDYFKRILVKDVIGDDSPVNDYFMFNTIFRVTPENYWGLDIHHESLNRVGSAWRYSPALKTPEDFDRLQIPSFEVDREATQNRRECLNDIFEGIMPVKSSPVTGYNSIGTLCSPVAQLRGLEDMLIDMIDEPELVHRLTNTILQGEMALLDTIEREKVPIIPNNDTPMFFGEALRPGRQEPFSLKDCWVHGNSQEFDPVSPAMFEEFLLTYQKTLFARFGAVCYGCCENLTQKLDMVLTIPNLKLLTCSAWTDMPTLVRKAGDRCCIMWRHKASEVSVPDDLRAFEKKTREQVRLLDGCSYQVVLREMHTLLGHMDRLREWTQVTISAVSA